MLTATSRTFVRFISKSQKPLHVTKCPPPNYDTGCTYCNPTTEMESTMKTDPSTIRNTAPPLRKLVLYRSNNKNNDHWAKKVEVYDPMRKMSKYGRGNGNMISMTSLSPKDNSKADTEFTFYVYPDCQNVTLPNNDENNFKKLWDTLNRDDYNNLSESGFPTVPETKIIAIVCGHTQRDIRCGVVGKMVHDELEKVIAHENLSDQVDVGYVSHVGGHVYAGNLIILKPNGLMAFYGMVRPHHIQGIVEKTIKDNEIIDELSRY